MRLTFEDAKRVLARKNAEGNPDVLYRLVYYAENNCVVEWRRRGVLFHGSPMWISEDD